MDCDHDKSQFCDTGTGYLQSAAAAQNGNPAARSGKLRKAGHAETQPAPEQEQPVAGQTTIRVLIKSSGGKVNIRTGNGTSYSRITTVEPGTTLEYVASAFNGWQAVTQPLWNLGRKIIVLP